MTDSAFDRALERGKEFEDIVDVFFQDVYHTDSASERQDRKQGIDRIFRGKHSPASFTVQYKTDERGKDTNNLPIETVSCDRAPATPGWALTCKADVLVFYVPWRNPPLVVMIDVPALKRFLPAWEISYETKQTRSELNDGRYQTHFLCVPITRFVLTERKNGSKSLLVSYPCIGAWYVPIDDGQGRMFAMT